eukprot:Nk52_evm39s1810 gene=Nk52_evmTU39s1810
METRPLRKIRDLGRDTVDILERNNVRTVSDVLAKTDLEINQILDVSRDDLQLVLQHVFKSVSPSYITAWQLYEARDVRPSNCYFRSTSVDVLDRYLKGGFICGTISEIVGPPGAGKTQFCLSLTATALLADARKQREGCNDSFSGIIYVDTEGAFSAQRLCELCAQRGRYEYEQSLGGEHFNRLLEHVTVFRINTCREFLDLINGLEKLLIVNEVKTFIVDSIASLVRKDFDSKAMVERTRFLSTIASKLKYIAESYEIAMVVTNQITGYFEDIENDNSRSNGGICSSGLDSAKAALGNTWAHCVNTRLSLSFVNSKRLLATCATAHEDSIGFEENHRVEESSMCMGQNLYVLEISKSPICHSVKLSYKITASGIEICGDEHI